MILLYNSRIWYNLPVIKNSKGFTLIELIVVIAVIGIISTIGISSFTNYLKLARDAVRKNDLLQIKKYLSSYYALYGSYPNTGNSWRGTCTAHGSFLDNGSNAYIPNISPTFVDKIPTDPNNNSCSTLAPNGASSDCCYFYRSNGTHYKLLIHKTLEGPYPTSGQPFFDPNRATWAISVCNDDHPGCFSW